MKLLRLLFVLMLGILLWGVDAQAQGSQWTGTFQIAFDANEPDVFYLQRVPEEAGTGRIGSGSFGYLFTDPSMQYSIEVVSGTGRWEVQMLTGGPAGSSVSRGNVWQIQIGDDYVEQTAEEGIPISIVKFTVATNADCPVGEKASVYSNFFDIFGLYECSDL